MNDEQNIANNPSTVVQPRKETKSEAALAANRANSKKCTGSKTREGKFKSCLNALRHGLYSHIFIAKTEDAAVFENFSKSYINEFQPATPAPRPEHNTSAHLTLRAFEKLENEKPSLARQESHQRIFNRLHAICDKKLRNETKFARDRLSFAA